MRKYMDDTIQMAVRRKDLQQVPLTALPKTFRFKGELIAGEINMKAALGLILRPNNTLTAYYDSDTTKTWTIESEVETVLIPDIEASTITITGSATLIEAGGF